MWEAHLYGADGLPRIVHNHKGRQPLIAHFLAAAFLHVHQALASSLGWTTIHGSEPWQKTSCPGTASQMQAEAVMLSCPGIAWKAAQNRQRPPCSYKTCRHAPKISCQVFTYK